jgi:drug/metabolite transporter (DMT)-like permease
VRDWTWVGAVFLAPVLTATVWWVGYIAVEKHLHSTYPHRSHSPDTVLAVVVGLALIPAGVGIWQCVVKEPSHGKTAWHVFSIVLMTVLAVVTGAVILFPIAAASCPPHAYECPI